MLIEFEDSGKTEYAGLNYFYGEESVMEGELFDKYLNPIDRSGISIDIGDDGNNCSVGERHVH